MFKLRTGSDFTASDPSSADSSNLESSSPSLLSNSNPFAHIGVTSSSSSQAAANQANFDPMSAYKSYTSSYVNGQQGNT